jgi:hypothetical protein
MDSSEEGRCGEVTGDLSIILITAAQLIFFWYFYEYIAWPTRAPDGSVTWFSLLTDDYFRWLPLVLVASITVIVVQTVMIFYNRSWFRQAGWILFSLLGITMTVSLLVVFPFDFSVIPNGNVARLAPTVVRIVLILMALFYAGSAARQTADLRKLRAKAEDG